MVVTLRLMLLVLIQLISLSLGQVSDLLGYNITDDFLNETIWLAGNQIFRAFVTSSILRKQNFLQFTDDFRNKTFWPIGTEF